MFYASVILEISIHKALDYKIPESLIGKIERGMCVEVPLRGSKRRGFILEVKESTDVTSAKEILRPISSGPVVTEDLFTLALWMAKYYVCPLGKVLKTMLPAGVRKNTQLKTQYLVSRAKSKEELRFACETMRSKAPQQAALLDELLLCKKPILLSELLEKTNCSHSSVKGLQEKGLIFMDIQRHDESPLIHMEYFKTKPKKLGPEQQVALDKIISTIDAGKFATHLLFGVTGSGKTEIYLQAIEHMLKLGKGTIMLVPEISLTPQTIQRFKSRFDIPIAVLHHRLTDGERLEAWEKIKSGECKIVIGARSAVFSPVPHLGLIIVDEEHEQSYKQSDDSPCYQARDLAVMRAKITHASVVLGSATPSLESYHNAINDKYILSVLNDRPGHSVLPKVTIIDMRREFEKAKGFTSFSDALLTKIRERKAKGEQTILFLNRRGYHTLITCTGCGKSVGCPHCTTSLTFHMGKNIAQCHLCGYEITPSRTCPHCNGHDMVKFKGVGTEKIEAMLKGIFPEIRTLRIDADTTKHKGSLEILLHEFRSGKADVLIGTQMVAKGLHFSEVTLVGVLNCDTSLNIPDFRAQESVFQLITQVAGRAGRGHVPGEVIIQTALPEHSTIVHAANQDYIHFFQEEIETRKLFGFPPFSKIVKFLFVGADEAKTLTVASSYFHVIAENLPKDFCCHPLVPAGHAKVKDSWRFQFLVRGPAVGPIVRAIEKADAAVSLPSTIARYVDVDPGSTFF